MKKWQPRTCNNFCFILPGIKCLSFFFFSLSLFLSCKTESFQLNIAPAFYHWQTHLQLTPDEGRLLDSLKVKKIFVKFFDVDINENNKPVATAIVEINTNLISGIKIIPTVFITNRTFENISNSEIEALAGHVFSKIKSLFPDSPKLTPVEYQFDCDWTQTTRDNYFYFLQKFKTLVANAAAGHRTLPGISATVRLHQLKYPDQTGIPPVDKGMLMFYNMGDLFVAEPYFTNHQYPIPLDLALPIYKWGVIFRNDELVYLINDLGERQMKDTTRFFKINENRYEVKRSTYLAGYYLYDGDLVRLEGVDAVMLEKAGRMLADKLAEFSKINKQVQSERLISFYHLDTTTLVSFQYEDFKKILAVFYDK